MNEIVLKNISNDLEIAPEYKSMLTNIEENMPSINANSSIFYKADSQLKDVTLNVADITPHMRLKHILARIEKHKLALRDNYYTSKKNIVKIKQKKQELETAIGFEKELLEIEIEELESGQASSENYIKGAIRQLNFMITQYNSTLAAMGKEYITEEEYELSEAKSHIATALKQALCAARSHNGVIDEGNHIYLFQLGINGTTLQTEMYKYFAKENEMLMAGQEPTHAMQMEWINSMVEKYQNNPAEDIAARNLQQLDMTSLVRELNG